MTFLIDNWLLILVALTSGGLLLWPALRAGGRGIAPAQAVQLMNREKAVVIDVCSAEEFAQGHIVGARNIPVDQVAEAKGLPTNKAQPLVVVCASGVRAGRAASVLRKAGHEQVHVLAGGMAAWREAGLPTQK